MCCYSMLVFFFLIRRRPPRATRTDTPFPDTTLCRSIRVTIGVQKRTPVGADSVATLELEGLTGGRYVELTGGGPTAPPLEPPPGRDRAEIQPGHSSFEQVLEGAPEMLEIGRAHV